MAETYTFAPRIQVEVWVNETRGRVCVCGTIETPAGPVRLCASTSIKTALGLLERARKQKPKAVAMVRRYLGKRALEEVQGDMAEGDGDAAGDESGAAGDESGAAQTEKRNKRLLRLVPHARALARTLAVRALHRQVMQTGDESGAGGWAWPWRIYHLSKNPKERESEAKLLPVFAAANRGELWARKALLGAMRRYRGVMSGDLKVPYKKQVTIKWWGRLIRRITLWLKESHPIDMLKGLPPSLVEHVSSEIIPYVGDETGAEAPRVYPASNPAPFNPAPAGGGYTPWAYSWARA